MVHISRWNTEPHKYKTKNKYTAKFVMNLCVSNTFILPFWQTPRKTLCFCICVCECSALGSVVECLISTFNLFLSIIFSLFASRPYFSLLCSYCLFKTEKYFRNYFLGGAHVERHGFMFSVQASHQVSASVR